MPNFEEVKYDGFPPGNANNRARGAALHLQHALQLLVNANFARI